MGRPRTLLFRVFKLFLDIRVASVHDVAKVLGISYPLAYSAVRRLTERGILEEVIIGNTNNRKVYRLRKTVWVG